MVEEHENFAPGGRGSYNGNRVPGGISDPRNPGGITASIGGGGGGAARPKTTPAGEGGAWAGEEVDGGRGLHLSTFQLNVSALCG